MREPVLGSLGLKLKHHWEEHLPRMTAQLQREGTLTSRLAETEQQMLDQEATLILQGMNPDQAREMTREIGFLPAEEVTPPPPKAPGLVERSKRLAKAAAAGLTELSLKHAQTPKK